MRQFLLKTAVFVLGLIILLNLLGTFADEIAPIGDEFIYAEQDYRNLLERREQIQAISIGNSHSAAVNFDELGIQGQVLTRAGADLFEVDRYIRSITNRLPGLKTVFISLSYYSFSRDNATMANMKTLRIQLYTMLPVWMPIKGDGNNLVLGKLDRISQLLSVVRSDHWQNIISPETGLANLFDESAELDRVSVEPTQETCTYLTEGEMENHAQEIAGKNVNSTRRMASLHPGLEEDSLEILAKTIEYLQKRDIEVVLYTPPYYEAYTTHFMERGSDIAEHMHQAVAQLQEKYHVEYYDFSAEPDMISIPELFFNSDHVNECGGKAFSARLGQAMQAGSVTR